MTLSVIRFNATNTGSLAAVANGAAEFGNT